MVLLDNRVFIRTDERILIECDFKISPKCKKQYLICFKNMIKVRKNNDGKDRCCFCFNSMTKTGNQNYNFKHIKNETFFEKIDSEIKAYLLGWVAGDGSLKKDGLYLEIHKLDYEIINLFRNFICPTATVLPPNLNNIKRKNTIKLIINCVKLVNDLCKALKIGIGKKSYKIVLPNLSDELMWHFIRGLYDSDGYICNITTKQTAPVCNIASMSDKIRNQIADFCLKYNIKSYISRTFIGFNGKNAINFMKMLYVNSNFSLTRKRCLYKIWNTWIPFNGTLFKPKK